MTLNLCVLTPNRSVWNSKVKEIILSTNSGQIGVLPERAGGGGELQLRVLVT